MSADTLPGDPRADAVLDLRAPLIVGFGVTSQAVASALIARGHRPVIVEDRPADSHRSAASDLGLELLEAPGSDELAAAVSDASLLLPSPGVPDHHPVFALARSAGLSMASEFDLAQLWDDRPVAAITGTNGKTTVTMMVADALDRSGRRAEPVGNTEIPFVQSIDDPEVSVFVVEASSFRLAHSASFRPDVAAWLNFAPDHLDAHASLEDYEQAKASMWSNLGSDSIAVSNLDDPVVAGHADAVRSAGRADVQGFSISARPSGDGSGPQWWVDRSGEPTLMGPEGPLLAISELRRRQPHDVSNALATAAIAVAAGGTLDGVVETLRTFQGLAHRLELLGTWDDVTWYNDSKATVPHATVAAVGGFESVVLIAGGRSKGLSFEPLKETVPPVSSVIGIGEAAGEVAAVYDGLVPVIEAATMAEAITTAKDLATPGDVVLLSPACASFDWYPNYVQRGIDFSRLVAELIGSGTTETERRAQQGANEP